jgi:sialic acid synthase SpsE
VITAADLAIKRPGDGIAPRHRDRVVGLQLARAVAGDQVLRWEDFQHES